MATSLTYTNMIALYAQFTTESTARIAQINTWIQVADTQIHADSFGTAAARNNALLTMAAHFLALADRDNGANAGGAGAVTARTTGEQITSYSVQSKADGYDFWRTTPYGQIWLGLIDALGITPLVT